MWIGSQGGQDGSKGAHWDYVAVMGFPEEVMEWRVCSCVSGSHCWDSFMEVTVSRAKMRCLFCVSELGIQA